MIRAPPLIVLTSVSVRTLPSKSTFNSEDAVTSPNIQSVRLISMWSGSPGTRRPK